uniref:Retrovirus-related Pol polyprotein from transposon TNT 1-94 n=1 Tax=Tanacetum cinerariifolium TaxID=118510 RepID=A0A699HHM1_TANCI|nr:retrovirus-related Pol polyprotein from transposon TNT 1-94 [Tanacetum cinerariifolium]
MITVRALLAIVTTNNWHVAQLDIDNAFLHGDHTKEIYMKIPQGYTKPHSKTSVCKLQTSLYGLKQSSRQWFLKLTTFLLRLGLLKDVVFDGAFREVRDEELVVREGVVVISSLLNMLTNSCRGGIMVSLIFLEGLNEEAFVEFMVEWCEEDEDDDRNEEDDLFN